MNIDKILNYLRSCKQVTIQKNNNKYYLSAGVFIVVLHESCLSLSIYLNEIFGVSDINNNEQYIYDEYAKNKIKINSNKYYEKNLLYLKNVLEEKNASFKLVEKNIYSNNKTFNKYYSTYDDAYYHYDIEYINYINNYDTLVSIFYYNGSQYPCLRLVEKNTNDYIVILPCLFRR